MRGEPNIRASRSASGHAGRATRVSTTGASDAPRYRGWRASTSRTPERMPRARTAPSSRASALVLISAQTKKKSSQRETNPVRPRLGFCQTWRARTSWNFLSRRPCPRSSRLSVFARDGRAGQCAWCPSAAPGDARRVFRVAETSATPFLAAFAHVDGHSRVRRAWRARRGFGTDSRPPGRCRTRPTRLFPAVSAAE